MIKNLTGKLISQDLFDYLKANQGSIAKVLSVHPSAVNFLADNGALLTLATSQHAIMPMGMVIEYRQDLRAVFNTGDKVSLVQAKLSVINSDVAVDSQGAEIWDPNPRMEGILRTPAVFDRLQSDLAEWLAGQPKIGLLHLISKQKAHRLTLDIDETDAITRYIANDLIAFVEELSKPDWQSALEIASGLVGLGMGSTPSCDDFLVAYLVVLAVCRRLNPEKFDWVNDFNAGIVDLAQTGTTLISGHMLEHAAVGKASRSYQELIHACLFEGEIPLEQLVGEVAKTGASSGMDFLVGLSCALDWFGKHVLNNKTKGGMAQVDVKQFQPVTIT